MHGLPENVTLSNVMNWIQCELSKTGCLYSPKPTDRLFLSGILAKNPSETTTAAARNGKADGSLVVQNERCREMDASVDFSLDEVTFCAFSSF